MKAKVYIVGGILALLCVPALGGVIVMAQQQAETRTQSRGNAEDFQSLKGDVSEVQGSVSRVERKVEGLTVSIREWREAEAQRDAQQESRLDRLESRHWRIRRRTGE